MKKYLTRVAKVAFVLSTSYFVLSWSAHAAEVACTNHWESAYSCDQCFQFFLTEADVAFSTSDIFYPRANLESDEKEILWIQDSEIRSFAMNSADIGPIGNVKNFFDFPHEVSNHASNGEDYTSFRAGESKTWARMKNGSAFGVQRIPRDADIDEPIFRIEYTTVSEVEDTSGDIVSGSRRQHKECAMYFPLDLNAGGNPSIEITKDDDDNHDDYQRINESTGRTISGEARFSGRAHFWIEVRNTGDVTLEDVYVTDDHVRECNRAIGRLEPGEVYDYTCVDEYVSESYTNRARVSAHPIGTHGADSIISDEDDTLVEVGDRDRDCRIEVDPSSGNAPLNVDIRCHCETNDVQIDIVQGDRLITSYHGLFASHNFPELGTYKAYCMPERDHSRRVSKTIFVGGMCGNGIVEAGEQCDDGNQANGDGCGDGCFLEQCGNGIVEAGEQCDDGNNRNGDGCTNICRKQFEPTGPNEVILIVLGIVALSAGFFFVRKKVL